MNPKQIFGISYQGSICHPDVFQRIIILQWQTDKNVKENAYILAHELGHALGIEHDFYLDINNGNKIYRYSSNGKLCTNIGGIMDYNEYHTKRMWSLCSLEDFQTFINEKIKENGKFCLGTISTNNNTCTDTFLRCQHWTNGGNSCDYFKKYFCPKSCRIC